MIQRIQSVWLLVAALISAGLFVFNILSIEYVVDRATVSTGVSLLSYNYILAAFAVVLIVLPLATIFMFKNRKQQRNMAMLGAILNIGFIAFYIMSIDFYTNGHEPAITNTSYGIASFLPIASAIFLFMAMRGISSDIKAVKSLDRLR